MSAKKKVGRPPASGSSSSSSNSDPDPPDELPSRELVPPVDISREQLLSESFSYITSQSKLTEDFINAATFPAYAMSASTYCYASSRDVMKGIIKGLTFEDLQVEIEKRHTYVMENDPSSPTPFTVDGMVTELTTLVNTPMMGVLTFLRGLYNLHCHQDLPLGRFSYYPFIMHKMIIYRRASGAIDNIIKPFVEFMEYRPVPRPDMNPDLLLFVECTSAGYANWFRTVLRGQEPDVSLTVLGITAENAAHAYAALGNTYACKPSFNMIRPALYGAPMQFQSPVALFAAKTGMDFTALFGAKLQSGHGPNGYHLDELDRTLAAFALDGVGTSNDPPFIYEITLYMQLTGDFVPDYITKNLYVYFYILYTGFQSVESASTAKVVAEQTGKRLVDFAENGHNRSFLHHAFDLDSQPMGYALSAVYYVYMLATKRTIVQTFLYNVMEVVSAHMKLAKTIGSNHNPYFAPLYKLVRPYNGRAYDIALQQSILFQREGAAERGETHCLQDLLFALNQWGVLESVGPRPATSEYTKSTDAPGSLITSGLAAMSQSVADGISKVARRLLDGAEDPSAFVSHPLDEDDEDDFYRDFNAVDYHTGMRLSDIIPQGSLIPSSDDPKSVPYAKSGYGNESSSSSSSSGSLVVGKEPGPSAYINISFDTLKGLSSTYDHYLIMEMIEFLHKLAKELNAQIRSGTMDRDRGMEIIFHELVKAIGEDQKKRYLKASLELDSTKTRLHEMEKQLTQFNMQQMNWNSQKTGLQDQAEQISQSIEALISRRDLLDQEVRRRERMLAEEDDRMSSQQGTEIRRLKAMIEEHEAKARSMDETHKRETDEWAYNLDETEAEAEQYKADLETSRQQADDLKNQLAQAMENFQSLQAQSMLSDVQNKQNLYSSQQEVSRLQVELQRQMQIVNEKEMQHNVRYGDLQAQYNKLMNDIDEARITVQSQSSKILDLERQIAQGISELSASQSDNTRLRAECLEHMRRIDTDSKEIVQLKRQLALASDSTGESDSRASDLLASLHRANAENRNHVRKIEETNGLLSTAKQQIRNLNAQVVKLQQDLKATIDKAADDLRTEQLQHMRAMDALNDQLIAATADVHLCRAAEKSLKDDNAALRAQIATHAGSYHAMALNQQLLADAQQSVKDLKKEIKRLKSKYTGALSASRDTLKKVQDDTSKEITDLKKEVDGYKKRVFALNAILQRQQGIRQYVLYVFFFRC